MSNANDMAFPVVLETTRTPNDSEQLGLTKREYIAARCLQGMVSTGDVWPDYRDAGEMASRSVRFADALLAELAK